MKSPTIMRFRKKDADRMFLYAVMLMAFHFSVCAEDADGDLIPDDIQQLYGIPVGAYESSHLLGWWRMEQVPVKDSSSQGVDLAISGEAPVIKEGLFYNAVSLGAGKSLCSSAEKAPALKGDFTFSFWIAAESTSTASRLIRWESEGKSSLEVSTGSDGKASVQFISETSSHALKSTASLQDGQWHHVAVTFSKASREVIFYFDGEESARQVMTGWAGSVGKLFTMGDVSSSSGSYLLDEVRLYDIAIPPDQIENLPGSWSDGDRDGLSLYAEVQAGTHPFMADTDGDGTSDSEELALGMNPTVVKRLIYVDSTKGDDKRDGLSSSLVDSKEIPGLKHGPKKTFGSGISVARHDDVICLAGGEYSATELSASKVRVVIRPTENIVFK